MKTNDLIKYAEGNLLRDTILPSINSVASIGEQYINLVNDRDWQWSLDFDDADLDGEVYPVPDDFSHLTKGLGDGEEEHPIRVPSKEQIPLYADERNRDETNVYLAYSSSGLQYLFGYKPERIVFTYKKIAESIVSGDQTPALVPEQFLHILSYDHAMAVLRSEQPNTLEANTLTLLQQKRNEIYQAMLSHDNDLVAQNT